MHKRSSVKNIAYVPRKENERIDLEVMASFTSAIDDNKGWWYLSPISYHKNNESLKKIFLLIHKIFYVDKLALDTFLEAKYI